MGDFTEKQIREFRKAVEEERERLFGETVSVPKDAAVPVGMFTSQEALYKMRVAENPRWMKDDS